MKLIYLIAGTYRPAGMERVLTDKVNWFAARGDRVLIVTTDQKGREPAFPLHPSVRSVDLGIGYEDNNGGSFASKLLRFPFKQMRHRVRLSRLLKAEKADIVVSMFCNDASFLPRIKDGSRKVLEIHFSRFKLLQYGRSGLWALADRWRSSRYERIAARYDRFVVLTQEDREAWKGLGNICVIPNPRTFSPEEVPSLPRRKVVFAAGRYTSQKGFDRLIAAWKRIDTDGWTLRIAGAGDALSGEGAESETLPENVITGPSENMLTDYASASIYALTSRYEGLPMVLLEAQAAGLPIVAMACKCGPRDVVTDGVDGYLVPDGDTAAFAGRLSELMGDGALRERMGEAARTASGRYERNGIMASWERLFEDLK